MDDDRERTDELQRAQNEDEARIENRKTGNLGAGPDSGQRLVRELEKERGGDLASFIATIAEENTWVKSRIHCELASYRERRIDDIEECMSFALSAYNKHYSPEMDLDVVAPVMLSDLIIWCTQADVDFDHLLANAVSDANEVRGY